MALCKWKKANQCLYLLLAPGPALWHPTHLQASPHVRPPFLQAHWLVLQPDFLHWQVSLLIVLDLRLLVSVLSSSSALFSALELPGRTWQTKQHLLGTNSRTHHKMRFTDLSGESVPLTVVINIPVSKSYTSKVQERIPIQVGYSIIYILVPATLSFLTYFK